MRGGDTLVDGCSWMSGINVPAFTIQPGNLKLLHIAAPHQSFLAIGSEEPIAKKSSFPSGEAKGQLRKLVPFNGELYYLKKYPAINTCTTKITGTPMENFGFLVL